MSIFKCDSQSIKELMECMKIRLRGAKDMIPINVFKINDSYILGVYEGRISKHDILIKYRQKEEGKWSKIRTPKHIHWVVDILMKMQNNPEQVKDFIEFLLRRWEEIEPITSEEEKKLRTSYEYIMKAYDKELNIYKELGKHGEYSIKFLIFLAELLMTQEKTNRVDAYMFKKLLQALKRGDSLFQIVSIATHTGR